MIKALLQAKDNPVWVKEMRVGFREKKVFYALIAWVVIVAIVASLAALSAFDNNKGIDNLPDAGKNFLEVLFWVQIALLAMLSPSLTTSAVSGERERKSFDMLLTTHLSPSELIFGKFGFAASFIVLALCATIPLESIVFFLGGVSLASFVWTKLVLCCFGFLCALYGLMMSARETRSAYATGQTYLGLVFICWFGLTATAGLRYAEDVPKLVYISVACTLFYLGLFLFWKSVNHLEERARHLKVLLMIGLGFYFLIFGVVSFCNYTYSGFEEEVWSLSGPFHYFLFGILLNPMRPSRRIETERFEASLLSRPIFWTLLLTSGLVAPLFFVESDKVLAICMYGLLSGLATAWFARSFALGRESRYPQVLVGCWVLFNLLPALTAIEEWKRENQHWHPASASPIVMLISYLEHNPSSLPLFAIVFYLVLFAIGQFRHMRHAARQKSTISTQAIP